jgi:uncharacterized protein involved in exopolysaccharide biosynthesis
MDEDNKNQFELSEIMSLIWRRKWLLILPVIIAAGSAFAALYIVTPVYETSSIIWVGSSVRLSSDLQRLVGNDLTAIGQSRNRTDELRSLRNEITSSPFIRQLVDRLKLDSNPGLDEKANKLKADWPHLTVDQIKFNLLLEDLRDKIDIEFSGQDQVRITVESPDPYLARDMAQNLSEIFIAEKMKQQLGSVLASQDFSYGQLDKYERNLQDKINARTTLEKELMNFELDASVTSDQNRRDIGSEIQAIKVEIGDKEEEARELLKAITSIPSGNLKLDESNTINNLKSEVETLLRSISEIIIKYPWNSSEALSFKSRLYSHMDRIEREIEDLTKEQFSGNDENTLRKLANLFNTRALLDMLYSEQNSLELALSDLNNKIGLVPEYQARIDQLNREVTAARGIRDRFKNQQESVQISQAVLSESEFTIIQPAQLPFAPVFPDKKKLLIIGILIGVVIGGGLILLAELLDNSFKKIEEVEDSLNLQVIGVIPEIEAVKKARLY